MLAGGSRREWAWALGVSAAVVALASLPYLLGWLLTPAGYRFTGLLINPIDGHSYLAKMGQGAAGSWLFHLPYTAEPHRPVMIFTFHLALGHLAPSGEPLVLLWVYHLTRVILGMALLAAVYAAAGLFSADRGQKRLTLLLVGLASGLGWLLGAGPDLTVPEAITFPSLLINAHFGLTVLLMLLLVWGLTLAPAGLRGWLVVGLAGVLLAMIQPFALLTVGLAAGSWTAIQWWRSRELPRLPAGRLALFAAATTPLLAYFVWMTRTNEVIGRWMAQNVTPAPPIWSWLVAYGLLWPLALAGAWRAAQRRSPADWLLLTWTAGQLLLMLLPISLQRRLSTGLHLPLCFLAAMGVFQVLLPRLHRSARRWLAPAVLLLTLPSNLLFAAAGVGAVAGRNPYVLLTGPQWEGMAWLRENVPAESVVLADELLGTVAPAWGGGVRVLYGHPFETPDADVMREAVDDFFAGRMPAEVQAAWLQRWRVDYILWQTDRYLLRPVDGFAVAWQSGPITILCTEGW